MSESHENITDQPHDGPPTSDLTNEAPFAADGGALQAHAYPSVKKSNRTRYLMMAGSCLFVLLVLGLGIVGVAKVRDAAARSQSQNNIRQMGTGLNNMVSNTTTGDIPPAYGVFPQQDGITASFFHHLIPYIECNNFDLANPPDAPIKTYIAPADPRNPGTNGTISYCTNGTLLGQPNPRLPNSFGGRPAQVIFVMERSGMGGAHKWTNANNFLGFLGSPPPFPQLDVDPTAYLEGSPQGFTSAVCVVGLGDGSARTISNVDQTAWNWLCDPTDQSPVPAGW